eukprot:3276211-Pleurochrysis_carterae.AAC.1
MARASVSQLAPAPERDLHVRSAVSAMTVMFVREFCLAAPKPCHDILVGVIRALRCASLTYTPSREHLFMSGYEPPGTCHQSHILARSTPRFRLQAGCSMCAFALTPPPLSRPFRALPIKLPLDAASGSEDSRQGVVAAIALISPGVVP